MSESKSSPTTLGGWPPNKTLSLPGGMGKAMWRWRNGEGVIWRFRCPTCGLWGEVDDDQFHGRVSIDCPGTLDAGAADFMHMAVGDPCPFHQTRNLAEELDV